jgi:hypothetical protein
MREEPGPSPSIRREQDRPLLHAIPSTDLAVLNRAGLPEYPIAFESENEENDPVLMLPRRDRYPSGPARRDRRGTCRGNEGVEKPAGWCVTVMTSMDDRLTGRRDHENS